MPQQKNYLKREKNIRRRLMRKTRIYFDIFDLSAFICVYPRLKITFLTFCWGHYKNNLSLYPNYRIEKGDSV
jgi:hypothetical protein